ncbi:unnamed protein product [Urochloa humidicola]
MGRLFLMHLEGNVYSCKHCKTHLGLAGDIISKAFHCKHGKAYLFHKVFKVSGPDGSQYWIAHDAHLVGSDPDDV